MPRFLAAIFISGVTTRSPHLRVARLLVAIFISGVVKRSVGQTLSIYGNLCEKACVVSSDDRSWCVLKDGTSEQCGARAGYTPAGDECGSACRKLDDPYFWCHVSGKSWEYCSPGLNVRPESCGNGPDVTRDPSDCSRYLSCRDGSLKLEECPVGLHFNEENKECEWPSDEDLCDFVPEKSSQTPRNGQRSLFGSGNVNEITTESSSVATTASVGRSSEATKSGRLSEATKSGRSSEATESGRSSEATKSGRSSEATKSGRLSEATKSGRLSEASKSGRSSEASKSGRSSEASKSGRLSEATKAKILSDANLAGRHGMTSHGELCLDACETRGYSYFWCRKAGSSLGQWRDSDFCSPHPGVTHYGEECVEDFACDQYGEQYFWCKKKEGAWGYCSPQKVYTEGSCSRDGWYALVGDCRHYVICRGGSPKVYSCLKGLNFDYLVLSCTSKENAKCVYQ